MDWEEYIIIQTSMIPEEFMNSYSLKEKVHNGYIFSRVTKGMYGLPQAARIAKYALLQYLAPYGYHPTKNTPGIWTHDTHPINFTLVVDDFGMKYSGKEHALHLKEALETK